MNEPEPTADPLEIGLVIGQRRAFCAVSGRCSAANAQLLRRIRDEKLYLAVSHSWRAFCPSYLNLSRRHADYLIALLNRFGPIFFELSGLVGISPREYVAIEPAVHEDQLLVDGESISLIPRNSTRIRDAVHQLLERSSAANRRERTDESIRLRITKLGDHAREAANQLVALFPTVNYLERELILELATEIRLILLQPESELGLNAQENPAAYLPVRANREARHKAPGRSFPPRRK